MNLLSQIFLSIGKGQGLSRVPKWLADLHGDGSSSFDSSPEGQLQLVSILLVPFFPLLCLWSVANQLTQSGSHFLLSTLENSITGQFSLCCYFSDVIASLTSWRTGGCFIVKLMVMSVSLLNVYFQSVVTFFFFFHNQFQCYHNHHRKKYK